MMLPGEVDYLVSVANELHVANELICSYELLEWLLWSNIVLLYLIHAFFNVK